MKAPSDRYTWVTHFCHLISKDTQVDWEYQTTGGGCDCYQFTEPSGNYWMITNSESAEAPETMYEPTTLGYYSSDGTEIDVENFRFLVNALDAFMRNVAK